MENSTSKFDEAEQPVSSLPAELLLRAFEQSPVAMVVTNIRGEIEYANRAMLEMSGYTLHEVIGQSTKIFQSGQTPASVYKSLWETISRGETWHHEWIDRKRDGSLFWEQISISPVRNEEGVITHYLAVKQAVSDRKMADDIERELLNLSPSLTGLALSETENALQMALERVASFLDADRAYIFEFNPEQSLMSNTHEWCGPDATPQIGNLQNIPTDAIPRWIEAIGKQEVIYIPSVAELPDAWIVEREILEKQQIKSLVVFPMYIDTRLIGFVGLDSVRRTHAFGFSANATLQVWAAMLSGIINNRIRESLLTQTRQNYETFFNTIDDFLFILDPKGSLIHLNDTLRNRLGYPEAFYLNGSMALIHPVGLQDEVRQSCTEILNGTRNSCDLPFVTREGLLIPVETRIKPGYWNGKPAFFGVSKDVTLLKLSEEKFAKAFHTSAAMMSISAFDTGVYLDVNQTFLDVLGYSREEVVGSTNSRLGIFTSKKVVADLKEKVDKKIPVRRVELSVRTRAGETKTGLLSADEIFVGQERCLLIVTVDITDRKRAEEALRMARIEAEKANAAKSEFISRISHELRTPMNSILGFAQLLQMGNLNPGQKKGVDHILRSGKHLLALINEVLDISRIESGRLSLSMEPVPLNSVISELIESITPQAALRNIEPKFVASEVNQLFVRTDKQRFKQILLNLLNNAVKYNRPGGELLVFTEIVPGAPDQLPYIRISVKDAGVGISSENLARLFSPFERIGAEKSDTEGTGLGLSVVKKLVEAMAGHVGVSSTPGEGSTFWVEFPQANSQLSSLPLPDISAGMGFDRSSKVGNLLYIEDNLSNVELVELILRSLRPGVKLRAHSYGKDALRLALEQKPDLILLDLNLPDIHGSEVLRQLKSSPETRAIPVVVISADATPSLIRATLEGGACTYLTKPVEIPALLKVVDENTSNNALEL